MFGCDLGEECASDDEVDRTFFNYVTMRAHPKEASNSIEDAIEYSMDSTYFKMLNSKQRQSTNSYYMNSVLSIKNNIFNLADDDHKNEIKFV